MKYLRSLGAAAVFGFLATVSSAVSVTTTAIANDLLNAGLGTVAPGVVVTGATYTGASNAAGTYSGLTFNPLSSISKGLLLTTGDAQTAVGPNNDDGAGSSNGGPTATFNLYDGVNNVDLNDVATLAISFDVQTATKLSFDFSFGSEEYWYYSNSPYNDSFFAFLDAGTKTLAVDSLGQAITVDNLFLKIDNRPDTFSPINGYGLPDKNGAGSAAGISELQYDGFTPVLRTTFDVSAGSHTLTFVVGDAGDTVLDSGVFISHLFGPGTGNSGETHEVATPAPGAAIMFGLALLARRRAKRA